MRLLRRISPGGPAVLAMLLCVSCATRDTEHKLVISVPEQRMAVLDKGKPVAIYPVSTSKFGISDLPGTWGTPLGKLEVATKIGDGAPIGAVFKDRHFTGEVIPIDAPGRDPIVTRVLWLRGLERQNANAFRRYIYIHGTPEERNIGRPASYGCIRMRSSDVLEVFNTVGLGAEVDIVNARLRRSVPGLTQDGRRIARSSSPFSQIPQSEAN
jgi:L,D-transpeptidase catalytic domain